MGSAAILRMVLSLYLSRKSSDFNEIWYADADFASNFPRSATQQNTKILQIPNGGRPPYWKLSFGYISTSDYPINAKFCVVKENHVLTQDTWPKCKISKIQDGGRPLFWKWFHRYISDGNHPISTKFGTKMQIVLPRSAAQQNTKILQIQNGGRPPYWKSSFGYILTNDYRINAKFCRIKQNQVLTQDTGPKSPKYQISKIQDVCRPPFWK